MKNINKIASEILKESADQIVVNKMKMLWNSYQDDVDAFRQKLSETFKNNSLSYSRDKNWILKILEKITGKEWDLRGNEFKFASKEIS